MWQIGDWAIELAEARAPIQSPHRHIAKSVYSTPRLCHFSRVRFLLPIPLLLALLCVGCGSGKKTAQQIEAEAKKENSRLVEQRRMNAVENGDVASKRGAEIAVWDPNKTFDPSRSSVGGRTYDTGKARVKNFYYEQKARPGAYGTRDFYGSKPAQAGEKDYAAASANTRGKYTIPKADKTGGDKTAPVKEAWDAGRTAATRDLHDGRREYLGPESKKLRQSIDPATMGDWRNGGESVVHTGSSVEKYSTLKPLTIGDIRELLNKNK